MNKHKQTKLALSLCTTLVASIGTAHAGLSGNQSPFAMQDLSSGYMVAENTEGKCGEGKCGGKKKAEDKNEAEGKCGGKNEAEGKCGGDKKVKKEGKCGEGKCGGKK